MEKHIYYDGFKQRKHHFCFLIGIPHNYLPKIFVAGLIPPKLFAGLYLSSTIFPFCKKKKPSGHTATRNTNVFI